VFIVISFILITLGLYKPEHTELPLTGFIFLFLLSFVILNNQIEYKIGTNTTSTFTYTVNADIYNNTLLTSSFESNVDMYGPVDLGGTLSHSIGYWLLISSVVGFIGVILGLRKSEGFR